jgi:hypothetical protein
MNLAGAIQQANDSIQWLDRQTDGVALNANRRTLLAAGCLDMAVEHQKAITLLIENKLSGSALSLVRLLFESYIRGLWLKYCATDSDLERFSQDKDIGKFSDILAAVEQNEGYKSGILSQAKLRSWQTMNSFTHTGISQVSRRHSEGYVEANYSDDELIEAIQFSCAIGWLVAIAICDLADNVALAEVILGKARTLLS